MADGKDGRGWSLVFDDQTRPSGEIPEEVDQRTAIDDGTLGAELAAALEDPRLKNVSMTLNDDDASSRSNEMTVRIPPPSESEPQVTDGRVAAFNSSNTGEADETRAFKQADLLAMVRGMAQAPISIEPQKSEPKAPKPAPAPVMLARLPDRRPTIDDNEELKLFDDDAPPLLDPALLHEEKTRGASRVRPVEPSDVRISPAPVKPVDYTSFDIPPALALVLVPAVQSPVPAAPSPAPPAPAPSAVVVQTIPARASMPTPPALAHPPPPQAPPPAPTLFLPPPATPTPTDEAPEPRLADVLREVKEEKKAKRKAEKAAAAHSSPRDIHADDFQRMSATTDTVARSIPLILVAFMILSAILISVKMLRKDESPNQTHVELRFLPIGHHDGPIVVPSEKMQRIAIDTVPPGLLVLYDKEILGRTPFSVDLPVALVDPLAAEISSPYYEAWVGELRRNFEGEYRIVATLKPR